jgi:hypothetical protein
MNKQPIRTSQLFFTAGSLLLLLIFLFTGTSSQAVPGPINGEGKSKFVAKWIDSVISPENGQCGTVNGTTSSTKPSTNLCSIGTATTISNNVSSWTWSCNGSGGGIPSPTCTVHKVVVNAGCGSASGKAFAIAPTTNLCSAGTPSSVPPTPTATGWKWTCNGENGGANSGQCMALKQLLVPTVTFSCPAPGTTGTASWSALAGAESYDVRVDDLANGWNPVCASPLAGDFCQTGITSTSFSFTAVPGSTYDVWARAVNSAGPGPESLIVAGTCADPTFTLGAAGSIHVVFSPALTSESTETVISVNPVQGFTSSVTFEVINLLNSNGDAIGVNGIPGGIAGFFTPSTLGSPFTGGAIFSVKVNAAAADPNNDQSFIIVVQGTGGGKTAIVQVPLTLKASNPSFEEE